MARFTQGVKPRPLGTATRILALANPAPGARALADLPFASKEVEVMGRYFPARDAREGAAATKTAVRAMAPKIDVLHIASHAEFRPTAPAQSRLVLASTVGEEGDLSVADIFAMESQADLVTLSACDSGLGRLSSADEIVGMERAFFYNGANTVVSSLWRISDVASAVAMKRFYRYLSEGLPRAEAMRQAQLVVRRYFGHPAYWSSFRVVGESR
jgi:CHAT domain-containing protein